MTAAESFHADMLGSVDASKRLNPPYYPTAFLVMVKRHGGVQAVKRLLAAPLAEGFTTLAYLHGRPDMTAEAFVLKSEYRELFTDEERAIAAARLGRQAS